MDLLAIRGVSSFASCVEPVAVVGSHFRKVRAAMSGMPCVVLVIGAAIVFTAPVSHADTSLCCPADVLTDSVVDASDLGILLGAWGGPEVDLNHDGTTDAMDLALLLGAWGPCPKAPCLLTEVVGFLQLSSGTAVADAVIVTDQGGRGVSGANGAFAFEVALADGSTSLQVTAVATLQGVIVLTSDACPGALDWLPTFGGQPGMDGEVRALVMFDDGQGGGPALYAGGSFTAAGGVAANRIVKWQDKSWTPLGSGMDGPVLALAVFDDGLGGGPALYAGGNFTTAGGAPANRIAKWNGSTWSPLGEGLNGGVHALTDFDDGLGGGPALYVGGSFSSAGGAFAARVAKWNGSVWSQVSGGFNGTVEALAVFDDGTGDGPALYAGGQFISSAGTAVLRIARRSGSNWQPLDIGVNGNVFALAIFDDQSGGGPALYAAGSFTAAGGAPANRIAKWSGGEWSPTGDGVNSTIYALAVDDHGSGNGATLYAGGAFSLAGGGAASKIAKWNGRAWSALGSGVNDSVRVLTVLDDASGSGPAILAGGLFTKAGGDRAKSIAKWEDSTWSSLGDGLSDHVHAVTTFDDGLGSGPALYAAGGFSSPNAVSSGWIAKWDGNNWSPLDSGMFKPVYALTVFDDGTDGGPALYAGGEFTTIGGVPANRIARWNGRSWSPLGSGMNSTVHALTVFDDGAGGGPALYAGGQFTSAGGAAATRIARWNGSTWSSLTGGGLSGAVRALAVFDDGTGGGAALYAGGQFTTAGGVTANRIAKWNGSAWSPLASGMNGTAVLALAVFDDNSGSGPALYAGGTFTAAGGVPASRIAKWNGTAWSALGSGVVADPGEGVHALTVLENPAAGGPSLIAGGRFMLADGGAAHSIAQWNGRTWSPLGNGLSDTVYALTILDDGSGEGAALVAGGDFIVSPAGDSYLAKWSCGPLP